jgi:integrase
MVEGAFDPACKRAGISNFVFHDLRHNCMTRWARENVAPAVAMRAMGWSSAQQLLAYTNLRNQDVGHAFGTAARRLSLVLPNGKRPAKKATK